MPRESRQPLNLNAYMKEPLVAITLKVPRSHYDLLTTMAAMTHQTLPDLVASLLASRVMADVEKLVRDSQPLRDDALIPPQSRPSVPVGPVESHVQRPVESVSATNPAQPETPRALQPTPSSSALPVRAPQAPTNPSISASASATQQTVPLRTPAQPLPPTAPRPITPPAAKPLSGDAEFPPKPETRHD